MTEPEYFQGQKAVNEQTGETLVYDVKKGWQAATAKANLAAQLSTQDAKDVSEARALADKAATTDQQAQRFMTLNKGVATGPGHGGGNWNPTNWFNTLNKGVATGPGHGGGNWNPTNWFNNDDTQTMESITSKLAPAQRIPGSGSSSDLDVKMFKAGLPSIDKWGTSNAKIADNIHNEAVQARARSAFYDRWTAANGTLNGAPEAFAEKLDEIRRAPSPQVASQLVRALVSPESAAPAKPVNAMAALSRPAVAPQAARPAAPAPVPQRQAAATRPAVKPSLDDIFR